MDLSKENNEAHRIMDELPINIMFVNRKAIVTHTNRMFQETFGKGYIRTLEKGPGDLLSCSNSYLTEEGCGHNARCEKCLLRQFLTAAIAEETEFNGVEVQLTLEGSFGKEKKWFEVKAIPIMVEEEEQFLITFVDISVYKTDHYDLLQHKKLAESANKAKSEFLANMSHEIRTPLNGVIGMLEMTFLTDLTEEQKENLEVAKNCADTLLTLINDILDLSKVESNKVVLQEEDFDIRELIQKVTDTQTVKIMEKGLQLECNIDEKIPSCFCGDDFRLQQVLTNLLSNAVKFTEKGSVQIEVKSLCRFEDIYTMVFSVEDSGIGLSSREINHLFKPFSQVDGTITRKYGGTGLGLAISQSLINLMGGEIKVKSQKGKGSVFFFTIQMKTKTTYTKEEEKPLFEKGKVNQSRILLIEDDRYNQIVTKQILNKLGYLKIDIASNGFEAIQKTEKIDYDVILMDIQLPEMDGMDTTNIIREKEKKRKKRVPIIAVTAHALKGDKEKFMENGMDGYVTKPIDVKLLSEALEKVLNEKSYVKKENDLKEVYAFWNPEKKEEKPKSDISAADRKTIVHQMEKIREFINKKPKVSADYVQLERIAHELKIISQQKEYIEIKTSAFRMELAARKKDEKGIRLASIEVQALLDAQRTKKGV